MWDPNNVDREVTDPFRTLFVARVNYYSSESKLRREFEQYGNIKSINVVMNQKNNKPRGYAFIEYEQEKDMHCKYRALFLVPQKKNDHFSFCPFFQKFTLIILAKNEKCPSKD